jgi:hypothetical protein
MSATHENRLLEAVLTLTKPIIEHLAQYDDDGTYLRTHTTEHLPLLEQLRDAVNPSSNTAAGSSSLPSTRNLIDSDALYRYSLMTSAIGDWCRIIGVTPTRPPHRDPVKDLTEWYIAYNRGTDDGEWYIAELRRWAAQIRNLIEPSKRIEVTTPCPVCGKRTWTDQDGTELLFPIVVEYRMPKDGEAIKPTALCRACDAVWSGIGAIRELGEELTERHAG